MPQTVTLTIGLPSGLRWGTDLPDPSEDCTGTEPAVYRQALEPNEAGTVGGGWGWDVVAERTGIFEITATVAPSEPDPNLANNSHTFRLEVEPAAAGGPGVTRVTASAIVLTPSTPRAGKAFTASVNVRAGGTAVRPSSVACAGSVGTRKTAGKPSAASGRASCRYTPPASAKGRTLRGSVSFTARGQRFTKRFAAKLR